MLRATGCPFGAGAPGRPSPCMMTSSVFDRIPADNLGYARVRLDRTIASGHGVCDVTVTVRTRADAAPDEREYYRMPRLPAARSG